MGKRRGKNWRKAQVWKFSCLLMAHLWIDWAKKSKMGGRPWQVLNSNLRGGVFILFAKRGFYQGCFAMDPRTRWKVG